MWILGLEGLRTTTEHNSTSIWQAPPPGLEKVPSSHPGQADFLLGK